VSDRFNDVLAAIDAETARCICGNHVPTDGASLDYCSPACQYGYSGPRDTYRLGQGIPDGPTLNQQVAQHLSNTTPIGDNYRDAMDWAAGETVEAPDPAAEMADWMEATTGNRLQPHQVQMLSSVLALGDARPVFETRGRNVMGPRMHSSDSIPAVLSPAEAVVSGPNGLIHIQGAYGDEPMQVTELDLDAIEGERQ
jgi:hypothetical protein